MILLTSTSDLLQLVTASAATVDVHASWVDNAAGTITPGRTNTAISTAATTTIVASPGASTQRNLQTLSILNKHASLADTVTVRHTDGVTAVDLYTTTLGPGEKIEFLDGQGFKVFDNQGRVKQAFNAAGRWLKTTVYTTGAANHTTQPDTRVMFVRVQAGGGGGGATTTAVTNSAAAGGGAAGGYAEKIFNCQGNTAYAYSVGAGGPSATVGGNTTFGPVAGVTVTANGGPAGASQTVAAPPLVSLGGAPPAVSTNGDVNGSGESGEGGNCEAAAVAIAGRGGTSQFGAAGLAKIVQGVGNAAIGFGSGGGGGCTLSGGASTAGGAGSGGIIVIDEMS